MLQSERLFSVALVLVALFFGGLGQTIAANCEFRGEVGLWACMAESGQFRPEPKTIRAKPPENARLYGSLWRGTCGPMESDASARI
jgi:hypothetical protein